MVRRDPPGDSPEEEVGGGRDTLVDAKRTRTGIHDKIVDDKREPKLVGKMFGPYLVQELLGGRNPAQADVARLVNDLRTKKGPVFRLVKVMVEKLDFVMPPQDGAHLKDRFRQALLGSP